jgi:hypothetical protein
MSRTDGHLVPALAGKTDRGEVGDLSIIQPPFPPIPRPYTSFLTLSLPPLPARPSPPNPPTHKAHYQNPQPLWLGSLNRPPKAPELPSITHISPYARPRQGDDEPCFSCRRPPFVLPSIRPTSPDPFDPVLGCLGRLSSARFFLPRPFLPWPVFALRAQLSHQVLEARPVPS